MELKQKARVMRKLNRVLENREFFAYEDITSFHGPSECMQLVKGSFERKRMDLLNKLNLTLRDYHEELNKYCKIEAEYSNDNPPRAHYDSYGFPEEEFDLAK